MATVQWSPAHRNHPRNVQINQSINQSKRNKTITTGVHADSSKHSFFLQFLVLKTAQILISAL